MTSRIPHIKQFKSKEQCFTIIMAFSSFGGLIFSLISCLLINWIEFVQSIPRSRGGASSENGHLGKIFQTCTYSVFAVREKSSYVNCTVYILAKTWQLTTVYRSLGTSEFLLEGSVLGRNWKCCACCFAQTTHKLVLLDKTSKFNPKRRWKDIDFRWLFPLSLGFWAALLGFWEI